MTDAARCRSTPLCATRSQANTVSDVCAYPLKELQFTTRYFLLCLAKNARNEFGYRKSLCVQGAEVPGSGELQPLAHAADDSQSPAQDDNAVESEIAGADTAENPASHGQIEYADHPDESNGSAVPEADQQEDLPRTASRVARPDSAQVARLIEGYDDDFLDEQDGPELYPEPEVCSLKHNVFPYYQNRMDRFVPSSLQPFKSFAEVLT